MAACSAHARPGCALLQDALAAAQPALQPAKLALSAKPRPFHNTPLLLQRVRKAAKFLEGRGTCLSSNQVCC